MVAIYFLKDIYIVLFIKCNELGKLKVFFTFKLELCQTIMVARYNIGDKIRQYE